VADRDRDVGVVAEQPVDPELVEQAQLGWEVTRRLQPIGSLRTRRQLPAELVADDTTGLRTSVAGPRRPPWRRWSTPGLSVRDSIQVVHNHDDPGPFSESEVDYFRPFAPDVLQAFPAGRAEWPR
jgi:hypothetical protein